jgi:DNA-binding beta-propeller fold protein YncE
VFDRVPPPPFTIAKRLISGTTSGVNTPQGVAVDLVNGVIAVSNNPPSGSYVTLYRRADTLNPGFNNPMPLQTLTGFANAVGVAFDPLTGDLYVSDSDFFVPTPRPRRTGSASTAAAPGDSTRRPGRSPARTPRSARRCS